MSGDSERHTAECMTAANMQGLAAEESCSCGDSGQTERQEQLREQMARVNAVVCDRCGHLRGTHTIVGGYCHGLREGQACGCDQFRASRSPALEPAVSGRVGGEGQDEVETEYERAIRQAIAHGDNDRAADLATGLAKYRAMFKTEAAS